MRSPARRASRLSPSRVLVVLLAGLLVLAGCSAGSAESGGADMAADGGALEEFSGARADEGGGESAADSSGSATRAESPRHFITAGSADVTVEDPRTAAAQVATYVDQLGGHLQERVESGSVDDGDARAYLVVRVPAEQLNEVLATLEEVGDVVSTSIQSTEVTGQVQDLDARIRAMEISAERLERLLAEADTSAEVIEAEQALTNRQEELEALQSQAARLADQVSLSTLEIHMWTPEQAPPEEPSGFWGGLVSGWNSLVDAVGQLLLVVGVLLPWLVALALLALAVVAVVRAVRRRRPAGVATPDASATGPTTTLPKQPAPVTSTEDPAED